MALLKLHGLAFEVVITKSEPATYATTHGDPGDPGEPATIESIVRVWVDDELEVVALLEEAFDDDQLDDTDE